MIQWNTQNKSFIKMHHMLKEMGINNNAFFLQLFDEDLLNVDPWNENLPLRIQIKIHQEICRNVWYFLREVVRVPVTDQMYRFELNRGTLAIVWAFINDLHFFIILPRQSYKTYTMCMLYCWLIYWGSKNITVAFFGHSQGLVEQNLRRVKDVRDTLPKYLNLKSNNDTDNARSLIYRTIDYQNQILTKSPGLNEDAANNVGRGISAQAEWYDEPTFTPYIETQFGAAVYAYSTVAKMAEATGSRHHISLTTTAGNKETPSGAWAYNFIEDCAPHTELLYDSVTEYPDGTVVFDKNKIRDYIANNNMGRHFLRIEYMWYDLSKPDGYLEEMRRLSKDADEFRRGVLNEWTSSNKDHPLGQKRVERLKEFVKEPVKVVMVDKVYVLKYYIDPDEAKNMSRYIVFGMDCGGNTKRDYTTLVGVNIMTFQVVCTLRVNQYSIPRFGRAVSYILTYLFPKSILIGERNYTGGAVLDTIAESIYSSRIYCDNDSRMGVKLYKDLRVLLFNDILRVCVVEYGHLICDKTIVKEIAGIGVTKSGRIDHMGRDSHDDLLVAYLYCMWFLLACKDKRKYVDEGAVASNIDLTKTIEELDDIIYADDNDESVYKEFLKDRSGNTKDKELRPKDKMFTNDWLKKRIKQSFDSIENTIVEKDFVDYDNINVLTKAPKEEDVSVDTSNTYFDYTGDLDEDDTDELAKKTEEIKDKINEYSCPFEFSFLK